MSLPDKAARLERATRPGPPGTGRVLLALLGLVGAGCGPSPADRAAGGGSGASAFCSTYTARVDSFMAAAAPTSAGPGTGVVTAGGIAELTGGMSPLSGQGELTLEHQQFVNLMTLIEADSALAPEPYLAASWSTNDSVTALTFRLRPDVYWHDGRRTTAYDVAFTYRLVTDPESEFPNPSFWDHYVRGADGVHVDDSLTVTFRLRPHAEYLDPWRTVAILPEHILGSVSREALAAHPFNARCPVGNGPFVFREHVSDERWVFTANPWFPEALGGPPTIGTYVYRVVPNGTTLFLELQAGSVDYALTLPSDLADDAAADPDIDLFAYPYRSFEFIAWNERRPPFDDVRVRRAMTMAIDRRKIVDAILGGRGHVAESTIFPSHWAFATRGTATLPYAPDSARALLRRSGWIDRDDDGVLEDAQGRPLSFTIKLNTGAPIRRRVAETVQAQLRTLGADVRLETLEYSTLLSQLNDVERRPFDAVLLSFTEELKLDDTGIFHSGRADDPYAWAGIEDPVLDSLLERLVVEPSRRAALPLWARYHERLVEMQPFTFLYFGDRLAAARTRLSGVSPDMRGQLAGILHWRVR